MPKRKSRRCAAVIFSSDDDDDEQVEPERISVKDEEESSGSDSVSDPVSDNDAGESSKRQALKKLLEPLGKDQIMDLLKEAAANNPLILSQILQRANCDPAQRKLFVHGFGWETTEPQLRAVFEPFGEIEELKLVVDKVTGKLKGYAFVLFKTLSSAQKALKQPSVQIGTRTTYVQLAAVGPGGPDASSAGQRKLFVKNIAPTVNVDRLREFFAKFGEIENGPMGLDHANRPRGYAIFEYKSVDGLRRALEEPVKQFEGRQLNCKKFIEKTGGSSISSNGGGSNLGEVSVPVPQNMGIGLVANPMWAAAAALNQAGYGAAMAGFGANYGLNAISPSVMASYGSQMALQGLGAPIAQPTTQPLVGWPGSARNLSAPVPFGSSSEMNLPSYFSSYVR